MKTRAATALACTAVFLVILDATIVSVALPAVRDDLGFGGSQVAWVLNAYTLAFAGFLLLGGRCADVFGHRAVLASGIGLFTAASLAAGLAGTPAVLVAARAAQGVGSALVMPTTLALVTTLHPPGPARARALAVWSTVGACGATAGTVLGGVITATAGWRWVFLINLPIGAAILGLVAVAAGTRITGRPGPRLDVVGAVLATAGMTTVVYGITEIGTRGVGDPVVWGAVAAGLVVLAGFGVHQHRGTPDPLLPPSVLRTRSVLAANAVMFLIGLGFFAAPALFSLYEQTVAGRDAFDAGLALLPSALGLLAGGRVAARTTVALGPRRAAVAGLAVAAAGFAGLAALLAVPAPPDVAVGAATAVFGLGVGASFTPITVVATSGVTPDRAGLAAGLLNTVRQASGALGLAVLTVIAARPGPASGYATTFALSALFAAAAAVLAVAVLPRDHRAAGAVTASAAAPRR